MDKVRFRTWFESEYEGSTLDGRSAVVEITAEQAAIIAGLYDELSATATAWSRRLAGLKDATPAEKLFVEADVTLALPFVVGPPGRLILGREEMELEIASDDEPFDEPTLVTWGVRLDAGWARVYVYAAGGAQAPMPLAGLRRRFGLDATATAGKPVTREAFDRLADLYWRVGRDRDALEAQVAGLRNELALAKRNMGALDEDRKAARGRARAVATAADAEIARLRAALKAADGYSTDTLPRPGEPVQLIVNAQRGPNGDRWVITPSSGGMALIRDELVDGWRRRPEQGAS